MIPAQTITNSADLTALQGVGGVFAVIWYILVAVALWKVFAKAGYPGILALIPIVNIVILVKMAGYSAWLTLLYIIPIVGWVFALMVALRIGAGFGKGGFFSALWLWLFSFVGYFIIGFGDSRYTKPV